MDPIRFTVMASDLEILTRAIAPTRSCSAAAIATTLLTRFGDLTRLCDAPVSALSTQTGLGPVGASRLHAALIAGRRSTRRPGTPRMLPIRSPAAAAALLTPALRGLVHEELHALYLDHRGRPLALRAVAQGSDYASVVTAAHLFRPAVQCGAHHLVLAHNHPSGDPDPSMIDISSTYRMVDAARVIGIAIADHLVVTDSDWTSMVTAGLLDPPQSWLGTEFHDHAGVGHPPVGSPAPIGRDDTRGHDELE